MLNWIKRIYRKNIPMHARGDRTYGNRSQHDEEIYRRKIPFSSAERGKIKSRIVAIDCETTGIMPHDRIITLAMVQADGLNHTGKVSYLIFNPQRKCHPEATKVHGWSDRILRGQDMFSEHAEHIREYIGDACIVAHNAAFDIDFLNREFERCGLPAITNRFFCTMANARRIWPGQSASLDACIARIELGRMGATHGALEDAFLAFNLYRWMNGAQDVVQPIALTSPVNYRDPDNVPLNEEELAERLAEDIPGIGVALARRLLAAGYKNFEAVIAASDKELLAIHGLGAAKLKRIRALGKAIGGN